MTEPGKPNWGLVVGVVAVVVAILGILVAHRDSQSESRGSASTVEPADDFPTALISTNVGQPSGTFAPTSAYAEPTQVPPVQEPAEPPPSPQSNGIDAVYLAVDSGNGLILKKGDVYEIQPTYPSDINPPYMTFRWAAQGPDGQVDSSQCNVSATISGPGEYPQNRRDGACSGRVSPDLKIMQPGVYTISIEVSPPGGGMPVSGRTSFTVVPHGG